MRAVWLLMTNSYLLGPDNWQVGGFCAFEDAAGIDAGLTIRSLDVRGVVAEVVRTKSRSASLNGDESHPPHCFT